MWIIKKYSLYHEIFRLRMIVNNFKVYIVFHNQKEDQFYAVDRKELVKLCEKICDDTKVTNPKEALHHKYTREGRKDVLSLLYFDDILKCSYKILKNK